MFYWHFIKERTLICVFLCLVEKQSPRISLSYIENVFSYEYYRNWMLTLLHAWLSFHFFWITVLLYRYRDTQCILKLLMWLVDNFDSNCIEIIPSLLRVTPYMHWFIDPYSHLLGPERLLRKYSRQNKTLNTW